MSTSTSSAATWARARAETRPPQPWQSRTRLRTARRAFCLAAVGLAAACAGPPEPMPPPTPRPLDYTWLTPLRLDVARVEIAEGFVSPRLPPNVDHRMVVEPRAALERMLRDRVLAWGTAGVAIATVTDAAMTEEKLARPTGLGALFGSQPSERYTLTLGVVLEVRGGGALRGGGINGRAEARVRRVRTVNDDVTEAERLRIWDEMLREAMDDARGMNVEFEFQVRQALRSLLVPEGTPRPNPAEVEVQELGPPGVPVAPDPANPPRGLVPGPGGTPGMGTLGTLPVQR